MPSGGSPTPMTDRTPAEPERTPPPGPPAETPTHQHEEPIESAHAHDDAATAGHGDAHGGAHDDHGHAAEPLGPIDLPAWGAGLVGLLVAAVTLVAIALATGVFG